MAQLTVQKIAQTGITPTYGAAASGGDTFKNSGKTFLIVKNGGASPINVTINSLKPCDQGFDHDLVIAVPNASEKWIGPLKPDRFNDGNDLVGVTYSAVTSVTVAAVEP